MKLICTASKMKELIDILYEKKCPDWVIQHSIVVCEKAEEISLHFDVEPKLIKQAAILHDIGRSKTNGIDHAVIGADIARELGFSSEVVNIVEKHIGAGITEEEAEELGLKPKSYMPETVEERIVAHADNLTNGADVVDINFTIEKWGKKLGNNHPSIERIKELHYTIFKEKI